MSYTDENSKIIDNWVKEGWEWSKEISHEDFIKAKKGEKGMFLTPIKDVPEHWLNNIKGKKILALASGGGQQVPVLVAKGAEVTLMDYSQEMINKDLEVSKREGYSITTVRGDMSKEFPFPDESFDMIVNPVSNIYIENLDPFWNECYRVLKTGGRLMAGLDNGMNFVYNDDETAPEYSLPFNSNKNIEQKEMFLDDDCGFQFSHDINEQVGGQLRAGFKLLEIFEDSNKEGLLSKFKAPFYNVTLSIKE